MMGKETDIHELSERIARLKAMDERYDKGWALLREDMAKRDRDNLRWQIGLWIAAVVILGFLIRL